MKELLQKFENKSPEIVFEWNDSETEAKGWVVINSLRGGAAGGGTRMRVGLDKREPDDWKGFGGRKFIILFEDGRKVITTNLWSQGEIPKSFREDLPNNAKFIEDENDD
jgi:hypothetical protein